MALTTFYAARFRAVDANGDPLPNAVLSFFEAGTATPLPVYADVDGNTAIGVTVTADAGGLFAEMFMLPQAYDIELKDEDGVSVWTAVDWLPPQASSSANADQTWTAGVAFSAGEGAYISDGSGGLNAGQAYKWDADLAYASQTPQAGFAVSALGVGESGLFRTAGQVSGLSGLVPGANYYMSGTAGGISTSPGTFSRLLGQALSTTVLAVQTNPPTDGSVSSSIKSICNGRLSLTTGVPVTTADVTAATTLYWVPYQGNAVALYSGTQWVLFPAQAQLSIAVPATTATVYDVFIDYNAGVPVLSVTAWTNDTTRATALTTQDGVLVKTGATGSRYVGSFRTTGVSGQTEDTYAKRYVWNYYNRVQRPMRVIDTANSWTYDSGSFQQANANAANQLDCVIGVAEVPVMAEVVAHVSHNVGTTSAGVAIGMDSTTAAVTGALMQRPTVNTASIIYALLASMKVFPAVGRHYFPWLEAGGGATTTWYGDNNQPTVFQSGISGWVEG